MDSFYRYYLANSDHSVEDDSLLRAIQSLEGAALKFSMEVISDAGQRDNYNRNTRRIKELVLSQVGSGELSVKEAAQFCYETRNKIMAEIRTQTSAPGRAVAERKKMEALALDELLDNKSAEKFSRKFSDLDTGSRNAIFYEVIESSARPNAKYNYGNKVLRVCGKVLVVVTIAYSAYEVIMADNHAKAAIKQGIALGGGLAGTTLASLVAPTICGPGAPICVIGLMLVAGFASGWGATVVADSLDDELEEFARWEMS